MGVENPSHSAASGGAFAAMAGVADDATDNTAALDAAVASLGARGGTVLVGPGVFRFTTAPAAIPSNVRIAGVGKNATVLRKAYNGTLLNFAGASNASRCQRGGLADLQLNGNSTSTGPLINAKWADHLNFDRVWCMANADSAVVFENVWDTYFQACEFDTCSGIDGFKPSVLIRSNADDSSNIIVFHGCRWENFIDGALWLSTGPIVSAYTCATGPNPVYGVYLHDCKMETPQLRGLVINMSADVGDVHVDGMYMAARGLYAGISTGRTLVNVIGTSDLTFKRFRVRIDGVTNPTASKVFDVNTSALGVRIEDIFIDATQLPSTAAVNFGGGNPEAVISDVRYKTGQAGTVFAGALAASPALGRRSSRLWTVPGAVAAVTLPPSIISLPPGKAIYLSGLRYKLSGGTSAAVKLQRNGVDVTGFTGTAGTAAAGQNPTPVVLVDGDTIQPVVSAPTGAPVDLTVEAFFTEIG